MSQLDYQRLHLLYEQERERFDPLERRLANEHLLVARLCAENPDISYQLTSQEILPPRDYRITFTGLKSIVSIDEKMLPVFADTHVLEFHLSSGFPAEAPICYMATGTWHPNIQSDPGPYQGRICGNTEGFGAFYSLDRLIMRVRSMLKFEIYHAEMRFPYPEDENAARWVREYAEPLGILRPGTGIVEVFQLPPDWQQKVRREEKLRISMV